MSGGESCVSFLWLPDSGCCWNPFISLTYSLLAQTSASIFPQPSFSWAYASKSFCPCKGTRSRGYPNLVWAPFNTAISSKTLLSNEVTLKPSRVRPGTSFKEKQVNLQPCRRQVLGHVLLWLLIWFLLTSHLFSWNLVSWYWWCLVSWRYQEYTRQA